MDLLRRLVSMAVVGVLFLTACSSYEPPAAEILRGGCPDYPADGKDWQDPPAMNRNAPAGADGELMKVRGVILGSNFDKMGLENMSSDFWTEEIFPDGWARSESSMESPVTVCGYLTEKGKSLKSCSYVPMSDDEGGLTVDMLASTFLFRVYKTKDSQHLGSFTIKAKPMSCPGAVGLDQIDMVGHIDPEEIERAVVKYR